MYCKIQFLDYRITISLLYTVVFARKLLNFDTLQSTIVCRTVSLQGLARNAYVIPRQTAFAV